MLRAIGFLLCLGLGTTHSYSQEISLPSPTAANLGKAADQGISLYKGKPNISIPLLSLGSGDIGIQVSASYDAGGVVVSEIPDWIGSGWVLNAGGVITRTVKGMNDEADTDGYLYNKLLMDFVESKVAGGIDADEWLDEFTTGVNLRDIIDDFEAGTRDNEPDIFYYNFNGRAGKFVLGRSTELPTTIPQSDLKIEYTLGTPTGSAKTILDFTVTTPDGVKYIFTEKEYSLTQPGTTTITQYPYATAWFLTSIESPSGGNTITFDYYPTHEVLHKYNNESHELTTASDQHYYQYHNRTNLKEIEYKDKKILFSRSLRSDALDESVLPNVEQEYKLDSIELKTSSDVLIKKFNFTTSVHSNRLFLDSIQEFDGSGNSLPPYSFDYINRGGLPGRLSTAIDHWGYYNGQIGNLSTQFISDQSYFNYIDQQMDFHDGANREVYPSFAKYGVLNKITYPTGGHTLYEYESNEYYEVIHAAEHPDEDIEVYQNIIPTTNLSNIANINAETFHDDGATPITISITMSYECKGDYLDYNGLYVRSTTSNEDYMVIDPLNQVNYTCTDFEDHYEEDRPGGNDAELITIQDDLVINVSGAAGTINFDLVFDGPESDDLISLDYQVWGWKTIPFSPLSQYTKLGPGLRVNSYSSFDGMGNEIAKKSYEYVYENTHTSGVMFDEPRYYRRFYDPYAINYPDPNELISTLTIAPYNSFGMGDRGFAGYSQVQEIALQNGKVEQTFYSSYNLTAHVSSKLSGFAKWYELNYTSNPNVVLSNYMGKPLEIVAYDESGSVRSKQEFVENTTDVSTIHQERTYFGFAFDSKLSGHPDNPGAQPYKLAIPFLANTKVTNKVYEGAATPVTTVTDREYADSSHKNPTKVTETNSLTNEQRVTTYQYAHEIYNGVGEMGDKHMLTQPYSVLVEDGAGNDLSRTWTDWTSNSAISPNGVWRLWKQSVWQGNGVGDVTAEYSEAVTASEVQKYDAFGNPIEVKDAAGTLTKVYYGSNGRPFQNATTDTAAINNARGLYLTGIQRVQGNDDCTNCGARPGSGDDLFSSATYDSFGRPTSVISPNEVSSSYSYDTFGRLSTVANDAGQQMSSVSYTLTGNGFSDTNPNWIETVGYTGSGTRTTREYIDGLGRGIQMVSASGSDAIIAAQNYNAQGLPWKQYKPFSRTGTGLSFEPDYDLDAKAKFSNNFVYSVTEYEASPDKRPVKAIPAGGESTYGTVTSAYSVETLNGNLYAVTTVTDQENKVTKTYTDGWGRTIRTVSDPASINAITHFVYDDLDRLTEVRPPNYHAPPTGSVASDWVITYAYDIRGNLVSKTSSDFGTVRYAYDKANRLRFSQDANQDSAKQVAWTSYDELGRVVQSGIADYTGDFVTLDADVTQPFESAEDYQKGAYAYDAKPSTAAYPWSEFSSEIINFTMDADRAKGQLVADMYRIAPEPLPADTSYSGLGIYGAETYQAIDTLTISNTDANSGSTVLFEAGQEVRLMPGVTLFSGADVTTRIEPSLAGTDSVGLSAQTGSSPWQLQLYSYDSEGRVAEKKIFTGSRRDWDATISYTYNRLGEITRRKLAIGEDVLYHHYAYNQLGQLENVTITTDGTVDTETPEITYTYTSDGMVDVKTFKGGTTLDHDYDIRSMLTSINDPAVSTHAFSAGYTYFKNGNVNEAEFRNPFTSLGAAHQRYKYVHTYDALNRLKTANYSNYSSGWQSTPMFDLDYLNYDKQGNITSLNRSDDTGGLIDELEYEYGKSNRLTRVWDTIASTTEDWDAEDYAFTYDFNGNLASQTGKFSRLIYNEYNLPIQIETTGGHTLKANYNGAGERIFKEYAPSTGGSTHTYYIRDGGTTLATIDEAGTLNVNLVAGGIEGQLLGGITDAVIDLSGSISSESESNDTQGAADGPMGLSMSGQIGNSPSQDTDWFYFEVLRDGTVTITKARTEGYGGPEIDLNWTIKKGSTTITTGTGSGSFSVTPGTYHIQLTAPQGVNGDYFILQLSAQSSAEYATRYFLTDHLGSTRAIVDEIGTHLASYDYYPFGLEMPGRSTSSDNTLYKYTGHERDDESGIGIDYMLARGYDPAIARFMQIDPLADMFANWTPYHYVHNNPLNLVDPTGMFACDNDSGVECVDQYEAYSTDKFGAMESGNYSSDWESMYGWSTTKAVDSGGEEEGNTSELNEENYDEVIPFSFDQTLKFTNTGLLYFTYEGFIGIKSIDESTVQIVVSVSARQAGNLDAIYNISHTGSASITIGSESGRRYFTGERQSFMDKSSGARIYQTGSPHLGTAEFTVLKGTTNVSVNLIFTGWNYNDTAWEPNILLPRTRKVYLWNKYNQ